jgi:hypothetical protein
LSVPIVSPEFDHEKTIVYKHKRSIDLKGDILFLMRRRSRANPQYKQGDTEIYFLGNEFTEIKDIISIYLGPYAITELGFHAHLREWTNQIGYFAVADGVLEIGEGGLWRYKNRFFHSRPLPNAQFPSDFFRRTFARGLTAQDPEIRFVLLYAALDSVAGSTHLQKKKSFNARGINSEFIMRDLNKLSAFRASFVHNGRSETLGEPTDRMLAILHLWMIEDPEQKTDAMVDYAREFSRPMVASWEASQSARLGTGISAGARASAVGTSSIA